MTDDDKKAAEEQSAIQKQEQEKKAIEDSENLIDDENAELYQAELAEVQQEELNQEMAQQAEEPLIPRWIRDAIDLTFDYECAFGALGKEARQEVTSVVENTLSYLEDSNVIQDFEETVQGFKASLEGGEKINFNLEENSIYTDSLNPKAYEAISEVVSAVGGDKLNISSLEDKDARFSAWENAENKGIKLNGLKSEEEDSFREKQSVGQHK